MVDKPPQDEQESDIAKRDTTPVPPPWAADFIKEVKASVADLVLEVGHVNTRLNAIEGGVKMLLAGDQATTDALAGIRSDLRELRAEHKAAFLRAGELIDVQRINLGELTARVEQLEAAAHVNGSGGG